MNERLHYPNDDDDEPTVAPTGYLLPCPFCGCTDIDDSDFDGTLVHCVDCGVQTMRADWNIRAHTVEPADEAKAYAAGYADGLKGFKDWPVEPAQREWLERAEELADTLRRDAFAYGVSEARAYDSWEADCAKAEASEAALLAHLAAPSIPAGGPVAWQYRRADNLGWGAWQNAADKAEADLAATLVKETEIRALYAAPSGTQEADARRWRACVEMGWFPEFCGHDSTVTGSSWYMPGDPNAPKFTTPEAAIDAAMAQEPSK